VTLAPTEDFAAALHDYTRSYFRLETLQTYRGSGEDVWLAAFERGDLAPPPDPEQDEWEELLRAHRDAGHVMQRVHVVVEPLTPYLRFELAWMYALNTACGERVGIVDATRRWPAEVPRLDFHLFDDAHLFVAQYAQDGTWRGVTRVGDTREIEAACTARAAALDHSQSWETFIADRPDLAARLPRVTTG
jgi:hypothetical protein